MKHTHKSTSAHPLQKLQQSSLTILTSTTFSYTSSFTITPTPTTQYPFSDHHSLHLLAFIPSIVAPGLLHLHLISCKQHTSITLLHSSSQTSQLLPLRLPKFHEIPNPHPKAPIRPPIILQSMLAHSKMHGCIFLFMVGRLCHTPQPLGYSWSLR